MFERLSKSGREFEENTVDHVNEYADAGLRTLILAYRELEEDEYKKFNEKFNEAKNSVSAERDSLIEEAMETVEKDLILLGATAVEDKLQNGVRQETSKLMSQSAIKEVKMTFLCLCWKVPDCIDKLAQAGIKIWVLTGDKMETAINIGYSLHILYLCRYHLWSLTFL